MDTFLEWDCYKGVNLFWSLSFKYNDYDKLVYTTNYSLQYEIFSGDEATS